MEIKKLIIKASVLIPMLMMYLFPIDRSVTGKGVLEPADSSEIIAPISGPFHIEQAARNARAKNGDSLFEIGYSNDRDLLTLGMRQSRVSKIDDEIQRLRRTREVLDGTGNSSFDEEKEEVNSELRKENNLKEQLAKTWEYFNVTDKSVVLTAKGEGFLMRTANDPLDGEFVAMGQHLGRFVRGRDLRITVLYPLSSLPDIQAMTERVRIKIPQPQGRALEAEGIPLAGPLTGGELLKYLKSTNHYLTAVETNDNKQTLQKSFGVIYEIKNVPMDLALVLDQEVRAKIRKPRALLISLWFRYAWLNWHIFTHQLSKEPLVAIQCFFSVINFWLYLPFIPVLFYFAGMTPWEIRKRYYESREAKVSENPLRVSAVVPFFNEGKVVLSTIESLAQQKYPLERIVLVDDGSSDNYFELMKEKFKLRKIRYFRVRKSDLKEQGAVREVYAFQHLGKKFILVRKENGGKGFALNCALNMLDSRYVVTLDGDTILDPDSLVILIHSIHRDPRIKVAHGRLGVMNNCQVKEGVVVKKSLPRGFVELCQTVEYFGFGLTKAFHNALGTHTVIIGAFACYEMKLLKEMGGFFKRTIVEDQDIAYEIQRKTAGSDNKTNIVYIPQAVAWTQVPFNWKNLFRQRSRWSGGSLETLMKYNDMLFNPKYGWLGLYFMPLLWFNNFMFWISLPTNLYGIAGLFINLFLAVTSSVWRGMLHYYFLYFWLPSLIFGVYFAMYDYFFIDRKYMKVWNGWQKLSLFLFAQVGYMIYGYVVSYFTLIGQIKALSKKLSWDAIERKSVKT